MSLNLSELVNVTIANVTTPVLYRMNGSCPTMNDVAILYDVCGGIRRSFLWLAIGSVAFHAISALARLVFRQKKESVVVNLATYAGDFIALGLALYIILLAIAGWYNGF